ncbi:MAG: hypothetical protein H7Y88_05250 [Phycisphaerales bacterium]|nr:hypothetical protein [Phycisphaerales bacterium]
MNDALRWLLSLDRLGLGDPGVELALQRPIPSWGWAIVMLAALVVGWLGYRRLEGRRRPRILLAISRAALLLLLALLIAGPRLVRPQETEERDWVIVLVDRSASMTIADVRSGSPGAPVSTREQQLNAALEQSWPMWRELADSRVVLWMGFDAAAYDLIARASDPSTAANNSVDHPGAPGPPELASPVGRRTSLGRALEQALRRAAGRPLAGVVILSDGRSSDGPSRTLLRRLEAEKVPVFTVPLGSPIGVPDVAVVSTQGPDAAFVDDLVPIQTTIRWRSLPEGQRIGKVQLLERSTGLVLDEQEIAPEPADRPSSLSPEPSPAIPTPSPSPDATERTLILTGRVGKEGAGRGEWVVRIVPDSSDLIVENNQLPVDLDLEDRPLRVLYFEGYPRWEYRYLKNLLVREGSIRSASLILSEGKRFVQEGDAPMQVLPSSPEEWREFDVIVIGDVHPGMFSTQQLEQLREHVGQRGAGLLWIGGEGPTPTAWAATPLADLLPFSLAPESRDLPGEPLKAVAAWDRPVVMAPAPAAEQFGVMRLADELENNSWWPAELGEHETGWSRLLWAQRLAPSILKPATEVLAVARAEGGDGSIAPIEAPLVVTMRFGAGRVLYVGTDETWRWRFGRGERLPERFWLQMVRMLGRESLTRAGKAARLVLSPQRAQVDQPVQVLVELLDQRLIDRDARSLRARIIPLDPAAEQPVEEASLTPESASGQTSVNSGVRRYTSVYIASRSGRYRVEVTDPALDGERLAAEIEIWLPDDELLRPDTDHAMLAELSRATEGAVLAPDALASVRELLPNRRVRLIGTPEEETLWDTPLALILVVLLLTFEWVVRRVVRLA